MFPEALRFRSIESESSPAPLNLSELESFPLNISPAPRKSAINLAESKALRLNSPP